MDSSFFMKVERPFIVATTQSVDSLDDYMYALRKNNGLFVVIMRGYRMRTFEELNHEVATALQVPWYFGNNWNAIRDCMTDLDWLQCDAFVIAITNCESVLSGETAEDSIAFGELLLDSSEAWSRTDSEYEAWLRPAQPFHIIMHFGDVTQINRFGDVFNTDQMMTFPQPSIPARSS